MNIKTQHSELKCLSDAEITGDHQTVIVFTVSTVSWRRVIISVTVKWTTLNGKAAGGHCSRTVWAYMTGMCGSDVTEWEFKKENSSSFIYYLHSPQPCDDRNHKKSILSLIARAVPLSGHKRPRDWISFSGVMNYLTTVHCRHVGHVVHLVAVQTSDNRLFLGFGSAGSKKKKKSVCKLTSKCKSVAQVCSRAILLKWIWQV